jgi:Spy/CpxP family protein refolding chaperone
MKTDRKKRVGTSVIVLLSAVAFVAACFVPAMADGSGPYGGKRGKGMDRPGHHRSALGIWKSQQLIEELELTDEQVTQLKEADFASQEKRLELKAQLDSSHLELQKAFSDDNIDDTAILKIAQKIAGQQGEMFIQTIESRLALGKILNPDQIDKLKQNVMKHRKKGPRWGKRPDFEQSSFDRSDDRVVSAK